VVFPWSDVVNLQIVDGSSVQALTLALSCLGIVAGGLGVAVSGFVLARGAPSELSRSTRALLDEFTAIKGEWTAQRASFDAMLDSIHTERDNVRKSQNRLSARTQQSERPVPQSRDEMLAHYRSAAGITQ